MLVRFTSPLSIYFDLSEEFCFPCMLGHNFKPYLFQVESIHKTKWIIHNNVCIPIIWVQVIEYMN